MRFFVHTLHTDSYILLLKRIMGWQGLAERFRTLNRVAATKQWSFRAAACSLAAIACQTLRHRTRPLTQPDGAGQFFPIVGRLSYFPIHFWMDRRVCCTYDWCDPARQGGEMETRSIFPLNVTRTTRQYQGASSFSYKRACTI